MRRLLENTVFFLLYAVTGILGLKLDPVGGLATLVWPPSGIALAAITLYGYRLLPAIALGALCTNLFSGASWTLALSIMVGNGLEAFAGAYMLRQARFNPSLSGLRDVLYLFAAALLSPIIAASAGSLALKFSGAISQPVFALAWKTWWMGDLLGILTIAPLILVWAPASQLIFRQKRFLEAFALGGTALFINWCLFSGSLAASSQNYPVSYALFVPAIWAALRFGLRGSVLVSAVTLFIAIWGTARGFGPFIRHSFYDSLLFAQTFIGVWTVSSLILAAAVSERMLEKKYLLMQYRIARIFTVSTTLEEAAAEILKTMGEALGWVLGGLWQADSRSGKLGCMGIWRAPSVDAAEFEAVSRGMQFDRGMGLPGRVWENGAPAWIPDVTQDSNFPRAAYAEKAHLHAAFAFPVKLKDQTIGVIEFFNSEILKPDDRILETFAATGSLIGQFIAKIRTEQVLKESEAQKMAEKKRAERELAESEARFRATFELAAVGIAHVSKEGRWIRVNHRLCEILGYAREELLLKTFQEITHPDDLRADVREAERLVAGEISTYFREKRYHRGDGSVIWANLTVSGIRDAQGAFQYFISVIEDITERKNYEEQIKGVNDRLQSLDRIRSEFISMISHELRTPLTAIKEGISLTRDEVEGPLNEDQKVTLDVSQKNIDRLTRLVNNVLQFSRMDTGKLDLALHSSDIVAAVRDAGALMQLTIVKKGIEFVCELPDTQIPVVCDTDKIQQILINLLDNSFKHTPEGGRIRLSLKDGKEAVRIEVEDTGIGISREDQMKIFGIFERGQLTKQMGITGGVGVGLAVCKKLAEQHGGSISVESEPGKGAKFTVTLPK